MRKMVVLTSLLFGLVLPLSDSFAQEPPRNGPDLTIGAENPVRSGPEGPELAASALSQGAVPAPTSAGGPAVESASAYYYPSRYVYVNGKVHYVGPVSGKVAYRYGIPQSDWKLGLYSVSTSASSYPMCRTVLDPVWGYGDGIAVYDDKIFYTYTADASCDSGATKVHAYCATYDLAALKWVSNKDLGEEKLDEDVSKEDRRTSASVAVLNSTIYVFTKSATYTSTDGVGWVANPAVAASDQHPLDAAPYYPPDDAAPKIAILYGSGHSAQMPFGVLAGSRWNGEFGSTSDFHAGAPIGLGSAFRRAALIPGTVGASTGGFVDGGKTPSLQVILDAWSGDRKSIVGLQRFEFRWDTSPGAINFVTGQASPISTKTFDEFIVYPWYTLECQDDPAHPGAAWKAQRQHVVINAMDYKNHVTYPWELKSDWMVPMNPGVASTCAAWDGNWGGSGTNTEEGDATDPTVAATRRKYWSLIGVILGSPPFAVNGVTEPTILETLSNVRYGQAKGGGVTQSQEWENTATFSAGLEIHAGLKYFGMKEEMDIGYEHAWKTGHETSVSTLTGYKKTFGTETSAVNRFGMFGWGIFNAPKIIVQDFDIFAYDYVLGGTGTSLNQSLHSVSVNTSALSIRQEAFELENPGGPNDDIQGLMAGVQSFPKSTDLEGWELQTWGGSDPRWDTIMGDGTDSKPSMTQLVFGAGSSSTTYFKTEGEGVTQTGETTNVDLGYGLGISAGTKLEGFKANLKVGYDSSFSTSVTNTSNFESDVEAELMMRDCEEESPDCVRTMSVQPYFLRAKSLDNPAPWIPAGYNQQLPWAITWKVIGPIVWGDGRVSGICPRPNSAGGLVVSGQGGSAASGESDWSSYGVKGAVLGWRDGRRTKAIPMTAGEFRPGKGVSVTLNGFSWSSLKATGSWSRLGKVWLFESRPDVRRNRVALRLDFENGTWDFQLSRADLAGRLAAGERDVQVRLTVNRRYTFQGDLQHDLAIAWRWSGSPSHSEKMALTSYQGQYDSLMNSGRAVFQGTLPATLPTFGDVSLYVNGHTAHVPLLSMEQYRTAWESQGVLEYDKGGVHVVVNFKKRTWTATFEREAFYPALAPVRGKSRIRFHVGGTPWYAADHSVADFTSRLNLRG